MTTSYGDVFVVTSSGSGHLLPCIQLCNYLSSRNYSSTLVLPTTVSSSHLHHLSAVIQITSPTKGKPISGNDAEMGSELDAHLSARSNGSGMGSAHPACAIVDFQMGWTKHIFWNFKIPVISFFTFSACAAAMEWGAWITNAGVINPKEVHLIPGLPEETHLTYQDVVRTPNQQHPRAVARGGPPRPGDQPPWVPLIEGSTALIFNTCDDLERPFIDYLVNQMGLPVFGVGPLLPNQYWLSSNAALTHDAQIRQPKHQSNYSDDQILEFLDKKPQKSVLYISFGSEVYPTKEEHMQLGKALQEMDYPFIWVLQKGFISTSSSVDEQKDKGIHFLDQLNVKIGEKGLIIEGWAPQLLILSHSSIGGFLSHCGWNSTLEAIGHGVPILAWPIRGDQIYNAKLVVNHLKIGYMALPIIGSSITVKDELLRGMEKLMTDQVIRKQADSIRVKFGNGFPTSSKVALDGLKNFVK